MQSVKKASLSDLDSLVPLFEAYRFFYGKNLNRKLSTAFLKARLQNRESVIYMAYWGKKAVGFTQLYPLFSSTRLQRLWLLNDLFVDSEYRQKGFASLLIKKAQQLSQETEASGLLLETEKSNLPANQLYPQLGFKQDNEHHYYIWETPIASL